MGHDDFAVWRRGTTLPVPEMGSRCPALPSRSDRSTSATAKASECLPARWRARRVPQRLSTRESPSEDGRSVLSPTVPGAPGFGGLRLTSSAWLSVRRCTTSAILGAIPAFVADSIPVGVAAKTQSLRVFRGMYGRWPHQA
jgi:hypothetical protein